ncbi:MAG TPA: glycosyltransferase [Polyangia bacterium]|nr:glycosyltransferase [Polyangia bacterium]
MGEQLPSSTTPGQQPLVTVYMPTKNRLALLRRAVGSVLAQTYRHLQLIVVDDASTDDTPAYLAALAGADPRVTYLRNGTSEGAPAARNSAIRAARGELVTGLDDDDWFDQRRLEVMVAAWQRLERQGRPFSCVYSQDVRVDGDTRTASRKRGTVRFQDLFFYNSIGNQVLTRTSFFVEAGLFDVAMPAWQDLDAFLRLLARFGPAHLVDEPLYFLTLSRSADRISCGPKDRLWAAYRRLRDKSDGVTPVHRQALFLQMFGEAYGFPFDGRDLREFWRHGPHLRTGLMLARILLRGSGARAARAFRAPVTP